jgi:hypothetical protein
MIGTSGPSSSTTQLSIDRAARAAIRCSMVETRTSAALLMTVPSWVWQTASAFTATRLSRSWTSVRTKTIPLSIGAGRTATRTCSPVCRPIPAKITGPATVC